MEGFKNNKTELGAPLSARLHGRAGLLLVGRAN
jgi:hypothetical protein